MKELVAAYERGCGYPLPTDMAPRRPSEIPASFAATDKAAKLVSWRAVRGLATIFAGG